MSLQVKLKTDMILVFNRVVMVYMQFYQFESTINKRLRIPKGQSKMDNPEKLTIQGTQDEEKRNKNTRQYVLDTTIYKETQLT